jgi:hypothetical protein
MHRLRRRSFLGFAQAFAVLFVAPAFSQPPAEKGLEKWAIDRALTITPMAPQPPVLKYKLLPLLSELKDGNAVPIYLRLVHEQNDASRKRWMESPKPWNELPIEKLPLLEAKEFLFGVKDGRGMSYQLDQLDWGARSKLADWNYTIRPGHIIELLLPDVQNMRGYVPMMALRARVQLAEGHFDAAAQSIATGFAFSRHVAEAPFLISGLVGIACARQFADCTADFIERPAAPNLYWSLSTLPNRLIDLRKAIDFEYRTTELEFPDLADLERLRSPAQWDTVLREFRAKLHMLGQLFNEGEGAAKTKKEWQPNGTKPEDPATMAPDLPKAKKLLTERLIMPSDVVAKMPPAQVLLLAIAGTERELRDASFKAAYLPYPDARRFVQAANQQLKSIPETELNLLPRLLLPAMLNVLTAQVRLDRQLAALRVIEAVRAHAAIHSGELPESLSQITEVPVPLDPGTGKPFEYRREGGKGILISRIADEPLDKTGLRYTITIRQ